MDAQEQTPESVTSLDIDQLLKMIPHRYPMLMIDRLEEIAAVEGVDALFIGPGDLSAALGCMGNLQDERVQTLMRSAAQRARAVGMPIGTLGPSPEMVKSFVEMGYDYVAVGSDLVFMMQQAKAVLARMKGCADHAPLKVAY